MKNASMYSSELSIEYGQLGWEKDPSAMFANESEDRTPERDMWIEVVLQALEDIGIDCREDQREVEPELWRQAVDWVMEPRSGAEETDFEHVCHIARLDPDNIRSKVEIYKCRCCGHLLIEKQCFRKTK